MLVRKWLLRSLIVALMLAMSAIGFVAYRISTRVLTTPPSRPSEAQRDPQSVHGIAFEEVDFATSDGVTLRGWLVRPEGPPRGGIVFSHGRSGSRRYGLWWLPSVRAEGFCSLLYDTRGAGDSDRGPIGGGFNNGYRDVIAAAQLLKERCNVQGVAALGMSQGASNSITAAAESDHIDAVVAIGAGPSLYDVLRATPSLERMPNWMIGLVTHVSLYRMGRPWTDVASGPIAHVERIGPRPLMLVHGSNDPVVPLGQAGRLYARARAPKHFWVIQDGGHGGLHEQVGDELSRRVLAYLSQHLPR